jgi:excisionase family DNA binding protein
MDTIAELVRERQTTAERLAALDAKIMLAMATQMAPAPPSDLLTAAAAAKRLGISSVYLYELARTGELRSVRIGRAVRFRPTDLDAFAATR